MSKFLNLCGLCVTAVILLTACGPEGGKLETADSANERAPAAPVEEAVPVEQRNPDVDFAVSPATVPGCRETSSLQAKISWQVRNTAVEQVRVEVADPGQENWKVLSIAGRQGKVETGAWVEEGTRFRLMNVLTSDQLASHVMRADNCLD